MLGVASDLRLAVRNTKSVGSEEVVMTQTGASMALRPTLTHSNIHGWPKIAGNLTPLL